MAVIATSSSPLLDADVVVRINAGAWTVPPIAALIVKLAKLSAEEAYRTLNMGIGFCFIVGKPEANAALQAVRAAIASAPITGAEAQSAAIIGEVEPRHPCGPGVIVA